uniref:AlNc14C825G12543 protein n=1 Tax=Albugo laibachii Nc14 TaxID=890382 RepID=F0X238_9STRA|nr:AlNc14C825G12543 [Albugo laibachii Nc14]|eukprot:CCA27909.1 AlNc14C825G12543 [Albugo laibachii Nc14]
MFSKSILPIYFAASTMEYTISGDTASRNPYFMDTSLPQSNDLFNKTMDQQLGINDTSSDNQVLITDSQIIFDDKDKGLFMQYIADNFIQLLRNMMGTNKTTDQST